MSNFIKLSILGVTSSKGFAICNTLLKLNNVINKQQYIIKGFTDNIKSNKSKYLIEKKVEMIELDLKITTIDILVSHLKDCNSVLLISDYYNIENNLECGIKLVDSIIKSNISQLICSTNSITNSFGDNYKFEQHLKSKINQIKYISFINIPFFYQYLINIFPPFKINISKFNYNGHSLKFTNLINENNKNDLPILNINNKFTSSLNKFTNSYSLNFNGFNNYSKIKENKNNDELYSLSLPIEYNKSIHMCDKDEVGLLINEIIIRPNDFNLNVQLFSGCQMDGKEISISLGKKLNKDIKYYYLPFELYNIFIRSKPNKEILYIYNNINHYSLQNIENDIINLYNFKTSTLDDYLHNNNTIKLKQINL